MQKLKELVTIFLYGVRKLKIFITYYSKNQSSLFLGLLQTWRLTAVYFFSFKSFFSFFIYLALLGFAWKSKHPQSILCLHDTKIR